MPRFGERRGTLSLTVGHPPDEALHSFLGRTAARNGLDVATFCREMGLDLTQVANGVDHAVARLADLTGADGASLRRNALVRRPDRTWTLNGEVVGWSMLRRRDARVCPVCLDRDEAARGDGFGRAAYCRTSWLVDQIRTCTVHAVELVDLPRVDAGAARWALHDFVGRLASCREDGTLAKLPARVTYVSGLESYLHHRLGGGTGASWLDRMPFDVVATFTERLGVAVLQGPDVRFDDLAPMDWKAAGDAGWEVMRLGPRGVGKFADVMDRDADRSLKDLFGEFWPFVLRTSRKPGYQDPCRAVTARLGASRPSLPRRLVDGGGKAGKEKVRLSTASAEYRRNTGTLRRLLAGRGILDPGQEHLPAKRIVVRRDLLDEAVADLGRRLSLVEAGRYLNAPNRQPDLLHAAGLLGGSGTARRRGVNLTVDSDDLDSFLRDLTRGAVARLRPLAGEDTIMAAARSARRPFADVARLVVEGRLRWVGAQDGVAGVAAVLVRPDEVRRILNGGEVTGPTLGQASRILRIPHPGVAALAVDGQLSMVTVRQRRTGQPYKVVDPASFAAFQNRFVSVAAFAFARRAHPHAVRAALAASGVRAALPVDRYVTPIYLVEDLRAF